MALLLLTTTCASVLSAPPAKASTGELRAVCPDGPVEAREGQDVLLLCHVEPAVNLSASTVDWQRSGRIVFSRRYQRVNHLDQEGRYRNRTALWPRGLAGGNLTLQLRSVTPADSGWYKCNVPKRASCKLYLHVTGAQQQTPDSSPPPTGPPLERTTATAAPDGTHQRTVLVAVVPVCVLLCLLLAGLLLWNKRETIKRWVMGQQRREEEEKSTELQHLKAPAAVGGTTPSHSDTPLMISCGIPANLKQ